MINSLASNFRRYRSGWLFLAIFLLALLPRVTTLSGTFIVNDEPLYWEWSNDFATALVNRDWHGTLIGKGYPSITVMEVHTLGMAVRFVGETLLGYPPADFWDRAALDQPMVFDMLGGRRLTMGLANTLLIVLIFWQARKLLGDRIAFGGAALLAFSPFVLADARTMRGDALMSHLMLLSALGFLLFLRGHSWTQLVFSGISLGLAILTKIVAIPVVGFAGLALVVYLWRRRDWPWPARLRWGLLTLAGWGAVTALTVFALWPALWVAPLEVFAFVRDYANSSIDGRINFFWGRLTHDEPLPLFYPNTFLFRATPLVVLGVAVMLVVVIGSGWALLRPGLSQVARRAALDRLWLAPWPARWSLLALGVYSITYWFVLDEGALKRDRYLMPVFPAAMFIAAAGLLWLVSWLGRRWPGRILPARLAEGRWAWVVLAAALAWELSQILVTHPFYYTYWSPLMGGGRVAMGAMMAEGGVDSEAMVYLSRKPNAEQEKVALLTGRDYAPAYRGETMRLVPHEPWVTTNYVMLRQYHYQTEKMDPELLEYLYRRPPEHVVEYQGYTWAWVYPGPAAQYYAGSTLEGKAQLMGYNLSGDTAGPEQPLVVKLFWRNKGRQAAEDIFVRLVDSAGFTWAETTASPLPGFEAAAERVEAIVESEAALAIPPGTPPGLYFLKMGISGIEDEPDAGEFMLADGGNRVAVIKPASPATVEPARLLNTKLSPDLALLGADLPSPLILTPQLPQPLTLYWQAEADISADYTVSLRLLDKAGQAAAAWLSRPARGIYPSTDWQQGDLVRDPWILDLASTDQTQAISPGQYRLEVALLDGETGREVGQAGLGEVEVADRLRRFEVPPLQQLLQVQLEQGISLVGYNLYQAPLTGGARFTLKLYWQAARPIPESYTVFVQVLSPDGQVVGQHDGIPGDGTLPTSVWEAGEVVLDRHQVEFSTSQEGEYRLIVGMYNAQTGVRLPVLDAGTRQPAGDFAPVYTFTIEHGR